MSILPDQAIIVGAYASMPGDKKGQEDYYALLGQQEWIRGIEIPFPGDLREDLRWLESQIPAHWDSNTITAIPGTMQMMWADGRIGLASRDREGRQAALDFIGELRMAVLQLAHDAGQPIIRGVQIHSAPSKLADPQAFAASLDELSSWDWAGARLLIEHCDSPRPDHAPEKGFLELEDEIALAQEYGVGIHLNWGRSAVEDRDAETPLRHIQACEEAGVLAGLVFSGAGPAATAYGYEWIDGHLPSSVDEEASLMTPERIAQCSTAAASAEYMGIKICVPPTADSAMRLRYISHIYQSMKG